MVVKSHNLHVSVQTVKRLQGLPKHPANLQGSNYSGDRKKIPYVTSFFYECVR